MLSRRFAPLVLLLALAGCGEQNAVQLVRWSPDGQRAAVIAGGLYLTDANGTLSAPILSDVSVAAWVGDSERLVLARRRSVRTWQALADALGPARARALARRAEVLWDGGAGLKDTSEQEAQALPGDLDALLLYLKDHYADALRGALGDQRWPEPGAEDDEYAVRLDGLVLARLTRAGIEIGPTLHESLYPIAEIVPAPGGAAAAFVTMGGDGDDAPHLWLAPLDGSAAATAVASRAAGFPAWAPDGRTLAYIDASEIGTLVERRVLDAGGRIALEGGVTRASLVFDALARVRYLPDGRLLFDTTAMGLPSSDRPVREEIFLVDPRATAPVAPLTPLLRRSALEEFPADIDAFEVSPDGTQILVAGGGNVLVVALRDGAIARVPRGQGRAGMPAVWRAPGEYTYFRQDGRKALVLRRGDDETELSCGWPDTVLDALTRW